MLSPRWSPNARYIVAFSGDSSRLMQFDATAQKWTDFSKGSLGWWPVWSRDGKYVYALDLDGTRAVLRIRIAAQKAEHVTDLKTFNTTGFFGSWFGVTKDDSPMLLRDADPGPVLAGLGRAVSKKKEDIRCFAERRLVTAISPDDAQIADRAKRLATRDCAFSGSPQ